MPRVDDTDYVNLDPFSKERKELSGMTPGQAVGGYVNTGMDMAGKAASSAGDAFDSVINQQKPTSSFDKGRNVMGNSATGSFSAHPSPNPSQGPTDPQQALMSFLSQSGGDPRKMFESLFAGGQSTEQPAANGQPFSLSQFAGDPKSGGQFDIAQLFNMLINQGGGALSKASEFTKGLGDKYGAAAPVVTSSPLLMGGQFADMLKEGGKSILEGGMFGDVGKQLVAERKPYIPTQEELTAKDPGGGKKTVQHGAVTKPKPTTGRVKKASGPLNIHGQPIQSSAMADGTFTDQGVTQIPWGFEPTLESMSHALPAEQFKELAMRAMGTTDDMGRFTSYGASPIDTEVKRSAINSEMAKVANERARINQPKFAMQDGRTYQQSGPGAVEANQKYQKRRNQMALMAADDPDEGRRSSARDLFNLIYGQ